MGWNSEQNLGDSFHRYFCPMNHRGVERQQNHDDWGLQMEGSGVVLQMAGTVVALMPFFLYKKYQYILSMCRGVCA